MSVAIQGFGVYVPKYRIKVADIAGVWGKNAIEIEKSLGLLEKSVAAPDEDSVTQAFEAARLAIISANITPTSIDVCFVGSESHPYAVNPTSTIIAEFLGIGRNYLSVDLQFACKAATAGIIAISGLIASGKASFGLIVGTDTAQAKPHDILEYTASSAAAACILGKDSDRGLATIIETSSYSSDTPDFWRRDGVKYPTHGGRFTGEPAYFTHVIGAADLLLKKTKLSPSNFDYCIFHMPNGKFPRAVAKRLGFKDKQLAPSLIVEQIGNPYSASSLLGLTSVLQFAKPGQLIFMVSYGSGAGADGFVLKVGKGIIQKRKVVPQVDDFIKDKKYISYVQYLRFGGKI